MTLKDLNLQDLNSQVQDYYMYTTRDINEYSINEFRTNLSYETWECIFDFKNNLDVDTLFNSFLNNYLKIFYNHFTQRTFIKRHNYTPWMTLGIRTSCKLKRLLYLYTRSSDDTSLKRHYKLYCKILTNVIKEAKNLLLITKLINQLTKLKQVGTL